MGHDEHRASGSQRLRGRSDATLVNDRGRMGEQQLMRRAIGDEALPRRDPRRLVAMFT